MTDHWQVIEDALLARRLWRFTWVADRVYTVDDIDAALAFVREQRAQAQPLDTPNGPGWWAWEEGNQKGVSRVYEGFGGLIVDEEPGGLLADYYSGRKWYKLTMPWEQRPQPKEGAA
jgi:hypothetical protein